MHPNGRNCLTCKKAHEKVIWLAVTPSWDAKVPAALLPIYFFLSFFLIFFSLITLLIFLNLTSFRIPFVER